MRTLPTVAGLLLLGSIGAHAQNPGVTGRWEIHSTEFGQSASGPFSDGRLTVESQGTQYTAKFGALSFIGQMQPDGLHLKCSRKSGPCGELVLRFFANGISGQGTITGQPISVTGKRPAVRPYSAPKTFDFQPTEFHPEFSYAIPPVLRIFPGDSVHTKTLDAAGRDEKGILRGPPGNTLTGPFYIEGAMPGDTLVIHFDRVKTNGSTAFQFNNIHPWWIDPLYFQSLPITPLTENTWQLNPATGTASLKSPSAKLRQFTVTFDPMLGCVGVAPTRNQVLSASHLGDFGGNMDSREVREGSTLYLPVFHPGALLFLGDGHARQGDGEMTGQGLETPLDVQFRVDVIEGRTIGQPWVEDKDYVTIMGISTSMETAFKLATTGMMRWLGENYGLKPDEIAAVLGNYAIYEIAEAVDPEGNVVVKLPKSALAQIPRN